MSVGPTRVPEHNPEWCLTTKRDSLTVVISVGIMYLVIVLTLLVAHLLGFDITSATIMNLSGFAGCLAFAATLYLLLTR